MPDGARYIPRRNRLANGAETAVYVVRYRQAGLRSGTSFSSSRGAVTALVLDVAS